MEDSGIDSGDHNGDPKISQDSEHFQVKKHEVMKIFNKIKLKLEKEADVYLNP